MFDIVGDTKNLMIQQDAVGCVDTLPGTYHILCRRLSMQGLREEFEMFLLSVSCFRQSYSAFH